jgi:hypothetical protein
MDQILMKSFYVHKRSIQAKLLGPHARRLILLLVLTASGCGQSNSPDVKDRNGRSENRSHPATTVREESTSTSSPSPHIRDTTLSVKEVWRIEGLGAPAGIAYDRDASELRLAQIGGEGDAKDGDGVISRVSMTGEILEFSWSRGMNAPKDLVFDDDSIWVTDIDAVVKLDRKTGTVRQSISVPDAKFLVGIAINADHRLLLADVLASRICSLKDGEIRVLHEGIELQSPSKLFCTENGEIVATWGYTTDFSGDHLGSIFSWNSKTREITAWAVPMSGHWMGLCPDDAGGWFLADFETGMILRVSNSGVWEQIAALGRGLGSVLYLTERRLLLAAHITENRLLAFHLTEAIAIR